MSGCCHMNPDDWCLSCASEKAAMFKARAEKAEAKLADVECHHGDAGESCGMNLSEDYACWPCYSLQKNKAEMFEAEMLALRADLARAVEERDAMYQACADSGWYVEGGDPDGFVRRLKEERDAALVLLGKGAEELSLIALWAKSPVSFDLNQAEHRMIPAWRLLRERGLLGGERG